MQIFHESSWQSIPDGVDIKANASGQLVLPDHRLYGQLTAGESNTNMLMRACIDVYTRALSYFLVYTYIDARARGRGSDGALVAEGGWLLLTLKLRHDCCHEQQSRAEGHMARARYV
jgi:hypothetical protein